jgi:hypothetical protein
MEATYKGLDIYFADTELVDMTAEQRKIYKYPAT